MEKKNYRKNEFLNDFFRILSERILGVGLEGLKVDFKK